MMKYLTLSALLAIIFTSVGVGIINISAQGISGSEYISGPTGTLIDGYYKDTFSLRFYYRNDGGNNDCSVGSDGYIDWTATSLSGQHVYTFYRSYGGGIYYVIDGTGWIHITPMNYDAGDCSIPRNPKSVIYTISPNVDTDNPVIAFNNSLRNKRTQDKSFILFGTVSDDSDRYIRLSLNGVEFPYNMDNTFTKVVSLSEGDNYFTVEATDIVGHKSSTDKVLISYTPPVSPTISTNTSSPINKEPDVASSPKALPNETGSVSEVLAETSMLNDEQTIATDESENSSIAALPLVIGSILLGVGSGLIVRFGPSTILRSITSKIRSLK